VYCDRAVVARQIGREKDGEAAELVVFDPALQGRRLIDGVHVLIRESGPHRLGERRARRDRQHSNAVLAQFHRQRSHEVVEPRL